MNSTEFWDEKKKEFEVRIINNPFICHKDLNNLEKVILRKFHGRRLNNAKEELGITKIRYSSMTKKVLDERIQRLKDYVRKNPKSTSSTIIKFDHYIFLKVYKRNMSKLREESGIEKLFCDDLISYLADNPWIKKGDLKGNYKSTLCVLFNNDFNDLKKEIGCPVFFKKTDNTDKILSRYGMRLKGYDFVIIDERIIKNIENFLNILDEKERNVIKFKYGIDYEPLTLRHIGEKYNLSKEGVRYIIKSAKKKLEALITT